MNEAVESFWDDWYYDDDIDKWVHNDEDFDFQWMIDNNPDNINAEYKENFIHIQHKKQLIESAWRIIESLPVHEEEQGKQDWIHIGLIVDSNDINKIIVVYYEANFDIYRETHLEFRRIDDDYEYINLYYEIA